MTQATTRLTQIGNSLGIIIPKELLESLSITKGDQVSLVKTDEGLLLSAYDPEVSEQLALADEVMKRYRNTLHKLGQ
jgi:putative addiction module antidote